MTKNNSSKENSKEDVENHDNTVVDTSETTEEVFGDNMDDYFSDGEFETNDDFFDDVDVEIKTEIKEEVIETIHVELEIPPETEERRRVVAEIWLNSDEEESEDDEEEVEDEGRKKVKVPILNQKELNKKILLILKVLILCFCQSSQQRC
jgi:hypothetical protein